MPSRNHAGGGRLYHLSVPPTTPPVLPPTVSPSPVVQSPTLPPPSPAIATDDDPDFDQWQADRDLESQGLDPNLPLDPDYRGKRATAMKNIAYFIDQIGACFVLIITLTFPVGVTADASGAAFAKFTRRFKKTWLGHWIKITELTQAGQLHIHLVAQVKADVAVGTDFELVREYRDICRATERSGQPFSWAQKRQIMEATTDNDVLRGIWRDFDETLRGFGFGRVFDAFPVINPIGTGIYLAKDLVQRFPFFHESGRKVQGIRFSKGCPRKVPPRQGRSQWFQRGVDALLAACGQSDESYFQERLEYPRWTYVLGKEIGPHLQRVAVNWKQLPPVDLAKLVIRESQLHPSIRFYTSTLLGDLVRIAFAPQPPPPAPSPARDLERVWWRWN